MDDMKLSPIWLDAFPCAPSHLEGLRIEANLCYPSLGSSILIFDGSLSKLQSLRLRNVQGSQTPRVHRWSGNVAHPFDS